MPSAHTPVDEPESLPLPRRAVYAITLSFLVGIFGIGGMIAGGLPGQGRSSTPTFTWMPEWGVALGDTTVNALLTYATVTLVLYGISIGGQAAFTDSEHRRRIRLSVGAFGVLLAASALTLGTFAVAATFIEPHRLPALIVVVPMVILCWVLGLEVGRFIVPAHHVQLDAARQARDITVQRLGALPRPSRNIWTAHLVTIGYGVAAGIVTGCVVQLIVGRGFMAGFLVGVIGTSAGLLMLLQINAGTIEAPSRASRLWSRGLSFAGYAALVLLVNTGLAIAAPAATYGLLAVTIGELLLPALFHRPPDRLPQWVVELSLSGAISRVAADDLTRGLKTTQRRIDDLEALQHGKRGLSLRARVASALRALR